VGLPVIADNVANDTDHFANDIDHVADVVAIDAGAIENVSHKSRLA
jgi:hypothetical protein